MQSYECLCGGRIFFDNSLCVACGRELGFCPACHRLTALLPAQLGQFRCGHPDCGTQLLKCDNYARHNVCNRCVPAEGALAGALCGCCRFNATIPDLSVPGNLEKWYRLEAAKRRLFYDLDLLGLPYGRTNDGIEPPLSFDFKADVIPAQNYWRSVGKAEKVYTGHANGRITINLREADVVEREKLRVELGEAHRTLIGHFRHEIGHFYWDVLVKNRREDACRAVFGDHNCPAYAEALETYYQHGPSPDWRQLHHAYATMHPWEDFAETWAAYLDLASTLDTAAHTGFGDPGDLLQGDIDALVRQYQALGVALNEMNRSLGLVDSVPEVFSPPVVAKLRFIHELVQQGHAENGIFQPAGNAVEAPAAAAGANRAPAAPIASASAPAEPVLGAAS